MIHAHTFKEKESIKKEMNRDMYKKILTQFCKKIETYNSFGKKDVILQVPEFYFGVPSYDVYQVSVYIQRQLTLLGYRTSVLNSRGTIHAAWGGVEKSEPSHTQQPEDDLPSLANLKKAADTLRKKFEKNK